MGWFNRYGFIACAPNAFGAVMMAKVIWCWWVSAVIWKERRDNS